MDDVPDRLLIPDKLYGRENETRALVEAFERVARTGRSELVLISGHAGAGKSAIVYELQNAIALRRCIFLAIEIYMPSVTGPRRCEPRCPTTTPRGALDARDG